MAVRTTIEWEAALALVTQFDAILPSTQVESGWPGDRTQAEAVWVDETRTTEMDIPVLGQPVRHPYQIAAEVVFAIQVVGGGLTYAQTMARVADIEEHMLVAVQETPSVAPLPDDPDAHVRQIHRARITDRKAAVVQGPKGVPLGIGEVTVTIEARVN
jgi:hypothetical protein